MHTAVHLATSFGIRSCSTKTSSSSIRLPERSFGRNLTFAFLFLLWAAAPVPVQAWLRPRNSILAAFSPTNSLELQNMGGEMNQAGAKSGTDSTVLKELKETIRNQAKQIEALKSELAGSKQDNPSSSSTSKARKTSGGGGGHGPPGELSEEDIAHYLKERFYTTAMKRVGWLGVFLASLSATAVIMNTFEHTLEKHIELSYFVPLLAGHGGNTGGQTVGTVLSALSSGSVQRKDAVKVIFKEAMAGIMSGCILGLAVSPIAYKILGISFHVAVVLFFTMPMISTIASTLGALIPFACVFLGLDPSVIAAPAMTSFVDVLGLMGYFIIANYIFGLYGLEL